MATVRIKDVPPIDGEYELDLTRLTNRELHLIKKETGVTAGEIEEASGRGDNDLLVMLAYIAVRRGGGPEQALDLIWEADAGSIEIDTTDEEQEQAKEDALVPPAREPADAV